MSVYDEKPWLALYDAGQPAELSLEYRGRHDPRVFAGREHGDIPGGAEDMTTLIEHHRGQAPRPASFGPGTTAILTYTSGTTGPPKGAMNTHGNVVFNSQAYRQWC